MPPLPPKPPLATRALPYLTLIDVAIRIGSDAIEFYHHVTDPRTKQRTKVAGSYTFTPGELAVLRAGGTVVVTDRSNQSFHFRLGS